MGKKSTPKPPDYTELTQASLEMGRENAQVAREQLQWGREQDRMNRATLERVLGVQLPIMEEQFRNAQEDRQRYEQVFLPIEDKLIDEFQNYGTKERFDKERGRAVADVNSNFESQRANAMARLESYGVDPSQTRNQALDIGMRTAQAAAQAGAADAATQRVENTGRALRAEAINIGRGLPSQVAQSYGQSIGAGQAGVGSSAQSQGASIAAMQSGIPFGQQAQSGYNAAGNFMNQGFQNGMAVSNFNQAGAGQWMDLAGSIGGAAVGFMAEGGVVRAPSAPGYGIPHGPVGGLQLAPARLIAPVSPAAPVSPVAPMPMPAGNFQRPLPYMPQMPVPLSSPNRFGLQPPPGYNPLMPIQNPYMATGGVVPEAGALPVSPVPGSTDRQPIMATPGEVVVPKDVVDWKGQEFFHKLNNKVREEVMGIEVQKRQPGAIPAGA